jgi:hypothetical protein
VRLIRRQIVATLAAATGLFALPATAGAITFGQVDAFQDGGTAGWQEGGVSPNPPTNIANGGPTGTGDAFLQDISTGESGAGSRLIMFNTAQWAGDYNLARVDRITAQMANFGTGTLHMRVALRGGPSFSTYGSTVAADLPPDGQWHSVTFDLTPAALTNIGGIDTVAQVLGSLTEVRILSAQNGPAFNGDVIAATLGVDNITARDVAGFAFRVTDMAVVNHLPQVRFNTIAGRTYRVERSNSLLAPAWVPLANATAIPGTGGVVQVSDTEPGAGNLPKRFYRAVLLP